MGQMFRCVFLVLALCFFAPSALAEPLESGGIWTAFGDVDAPVKTCSIQGAVNDGIFKLSTASDHQNVLHLQLSKVAWDIPNRAVPVTFTFPNGGLFTFIGRGQGSAMDFDVPLSDMRSFIHQFTAEPTGTLYFPEGREKTLVASVVRINPDHHRNGQVHGYRRDCTATLRRTINAYCSNRFSVSTGGYR